MPPLAGEGCLNPRQCMAPAGTILYWIARSNDGGATWFWHARTCLNDDERDSLQVVSWRQVWMSMKKLRWPEANLTIQPPGGRTLVNFETNFLTNTTQATVQTVTLLGRRVEIEATPVDYTWHFGDGGTQSGPDPGAGYPDLRITHVYREAAEVTPSVDVTYHGRFRVNDAAWQDIPEELTVQGSPVALEVLTATPRLVG
jgi:PKD domain-containing protein